MNDKIGAWSFYGTLIGIVVIGSLYTIIDEGILSFSADILSIILKISAFFLVIYIITLFPDKWVPSIFTIAFLAFLRKIAERPLFQ